MASGKGLLCPLPISAKHGKTTSEKTIKYTVRQCRKGRKTSEIAQEVGVSQRRIQRLWAEFRRTEIPHVPLQPGRKPVPIPEEKAQAVLRQHKKGRTGVCYTAKRLKKESHDISYHRVYRIMKENYLVIPSPAKSRRRKWVRYELLHSNAMWHVNWQYDEGSTPERRGWLRFLTAPRGA